MINEIKLTLLKVKKNQSIVTPLGNEPQECDTIIIVKKKVRQHLTSLLFMIHSVEEVIILCLLT